MITLHTFTKLKKVLIIVSLMICSVTATHAYSIPWRQKASFQFAKEISLSELIRGYFALQGITVVLDKDVEGSVTGKFQDLSPEEFLNRLSRSYSLIWFYDGNVLYIYPAQKVQSKFVPISNLASKKLLDTVSSLGIIAPSSAIRLVGSTGITFVSGPPRYVEMVAEIINQLNNTLETDFKGTLKVRVFPLKHAWAYDTSYATMETRITIPGLATVLRGLMETDTGMPVSPDAIVSGQIVNDRIQVASKHPTFNQINGLQTFHKKEILPYNNIDPTLPPPPNPPIPMGPTLIQPDIRLNAIIVRDVEEKMSQYETLIEELDIPVFLIEISVAIVDINTNFTSSIGNAFFSATKGDSSIAFNTLGLTGVTPLATGFNFQAGAIWDGYKIISQIEALAAEGYANILARPSVLTLNNVEATLTKSTTFYVRLIGQDASDLATVTVGTILRVTPRVIIDEDGTRKIKLLINLNDGNIDSSSGVDNLPTTTDATITTQAVIYEGQSLFIGGYYRQEKGSNESGIPILKDLPWLGYIFKTVTHTDTTMERMYLIMPRIINLDFEHAPCITDQICDFKPPAWGIAHEMAKRNMKCEFPLCPEYTPDIDCCFHPSAGYYRLPPSLGFKIYRYFE